MPRYYFNFRNERGLMPDPNGIEFENVEEAYLEAFAGAQEIWAEMLKERKDPRICSFEIADAAGILLIELPFAEILNDCTRMERSKVVDEVSIKKFQLSIKRSKKLRAELLLQVSRLQDTLESTRRLLVRASA